MTTRKRGQPDARRRATKKNPKKSLARRCIRIAGALVARHPSVAGGSAAFAVIFGFVAANAVWYQPEGHPSPFFATRAMPAGAAARSARHAARLDNARPSVDQILKGLARANAADAGVTSDATASIPVPQAPAATVTDATALVVAIQKGLAAHQFYSGPYDGQLSVATRAAIEAFQAARGETLTGQPSAQLLVEIDSTTRNAVAVPRSRPAPVVDAAAGPGGDPIARLVSASGPAAQASAASASASVTPPDMVSRIQAGLRNIAYSDVAVDGIAGAKTRAAIRNFEKNYRLPETGEPNRRVLDKLIAIGAL